MPIHRQFPPTEPVTCTQFATAIQNITRRPTTTPTPCLTQPITRLQAAELISSSIPPMNLGIAGGIIPPFPDIQTLTFDQKNAIRVAYAAGVMFASYQNYFEPYRQMLGTEANETLARLRARLYPHLRQTLPYQIITDPSALPPQVTQVAEATKTRPGGYVVQEPHATYVIISAGEYPTGGYALQVNSVRQVANHIEIDVELQTPAPDMMVIQVLTYPQLIIKMSKTDLPIEIV